jgi:hypothetical protein
LLRGARFGKGKILKARGGRPHSAVRVGGAIICALGVKKHDIGEG